MKDEDGLTINVASGLARSQHRDIMKGLSEMSESIEKLNTEVADLQETQGKISDGIAGIRTQLEEATTQNAVLSEALSSALEQGELDRATIEELQKAADATSTAIDAATAQLDTVDEALEDLSGENTTEATS